MVKVKHKMAFKKSMRDAKGPDPENPYVAPVPKEAVFRKAEDACKELAATDVEIRDQALNDVHAMLRWLETDEHRNADVDAPLEFAKLWKGLFYCMWHSDKPLVQLACADRIADLVTILTTWGNRTEWQKQAWLCMNREWPLIDKWRVDKFYALMRRIFNRGLQVFQQAPVDAVAAFAQPLGDLYVNRITGVASHVTDIFIEECVAVNLDMEHFHALFFTLVFPVLCHGSPDHCSHIYDYIWTKMLGGYKEEDATIEYLSDIEWDTLLDKLQEAAVDESTHDKNRGLLTKMAEELETFLDQAGEVEELVEIDSDEEVFEVRQDTRKSIELTRREQEQSEAKKMKDVKEKRAVERKVKKALAVGDGKAATDLVNKARKEGVKVPKRKKKKGKLAGVVDEHGNLKKKQKTRHKKRRV